MKIMTFLLINEMKLKNQLIVVIDSLHLSHRLPTKIAALSCTIFVLISETAAGNRA